DNIGHYGLAFPYYTHFTSPIRRYPDMMVHRLLAHYLAGGKSPKKEEYEALASHSSDREIIAANAERASIKYKAVEFMQGRMDEEFDGHISGIKEWGIFVEVDETHIEGMVPVRDLGDDYYEYNDDRYEFAGRSTGETFTLGDAVRVKIKRADLAKRMLDFTLIEKIKE
ncbi:MAG: RNB domain-containing ribonuclease, partial [Rikenellaceae bacterium]